MISKLPKRRIWQALTLVIVLWYYWALPAQLFQHPTSTVIEDQNGNLLGAQIAKDGQWRFPHNPNIPYKFAMAITQFEDRHFFEHNGVHLPSLFRAFKQNWSEGRKVSGGSTLSMQVIRLSREGRQRTYFEKLIEFALATRLELSYSKEEILALYASNAPFGGNVVGLDAAAWRYYGRNADELSWGESATLAVLPNAPALIYPGKNHDELLRKRNQLLDRLQDIGVLDALDCELAKAEPLPEKPHPLPRLSPHLLMRAAAEGYQGKRCVTTLDPYLQEQANHLVSLHHQTLRNKQVYNAAAIIIEVETGKVLAYVGNTRSDNPDHGCDVDVITAPRSTGSVMKPFLFASMLSDGELLPNTLVPDVPTTMKGFAPKNFSLTYDGAVPAKRALSRSLNIPAVRMLHQYGQDKFHFLLQRLNQRYINKPAEHYGLSIILGGAESSLWDLTGAYASMSRTLNHCNGVYGGKYAANDFRSPHYLASQTPALADDEELNQAGILNAGAIYLTYQALLEVNRPENETGFESFSSSGKVAWKTGTSFGHRDAWAIGTTRDYVVGVWVGNADGEGRPDITGSSVAAPLLFDLLDLLPTSHWFSPPYDDMEEIEVCRKSGHRALAICEETDSMWVPAKGLETGPCTYHRLVHLEPNGVFQTSSECTEPHQMVAKSWFVLPPVQEYYYKSKNPRYRSLPPFDPSCTAESSLRPMELIYPKDDMQLYVPVELDGEQGAIIFEVAHRTPNATIYWHLDNEYLGNTFGIHQKSMSPPPGMHRLTLVDEDGNTLEQTFEILGER